MVQRGSGLGLPAEPGLEGRIAGEVGTQRLHRDIAAEAHVPAHVDLGHATPAEHSAQLVAAADETRLIHWSLPFLLPTSRRSGIFRDCPCWRARASPRARDHRGNA